MKGQENSSGWLFGTWQHLTADPMQVVWRYLFAFLGVGLAMWLNIFSTFHMPDNELQHILPRWGNSITVALLFGHMVAFVVLLGSEYPARLRGYWSRRIHIPVTALLGFGVLTWLFYTMLVLNRTEPDWGLMILGGFTLGLGFVVSGIFNLPGWLAAAITAIATYLPIYLAFDRFWVDNSVAALLYYDKSGHIYSVAIPFVLLVAVGGHAQALYQWLSSISSADIETETADSSPLA